MESVGKVCGEFVMLYPPGIPILAPGEMITKDIYIISDIISAAIFFIKDSFFRSGGFDYLLFEYAKAAEDQEFFLNMDRLP